MELIINMLQQISFVTAQVTEATISSVLNSVPNAVAEPWFIRLWNAPGFSEWFSELTVGFFTLIGTLIGGIGVAVYTIRHQKTQEIVAKKKQVAENILNPFNDVLLGFEQIEDKRGLPLMARAVMTVFYSLKVEEKELRKQLKKAQTLAKLYTPNYIDGTVSTLSSWCLGILDQAKIEDSQFQQIKELVDDLSKDLIKWIGSDEIKGGDKTFEDIAKEVEEKKSRK